MRSTLPVLFAACLVACAAPVPEGLGLAPEGAGPRVNFDVMAKPLPEIPLPNDFASRFDATSPTLHRINASIEAAPTQWEKKTRAGLDQMSGWGTLAPLTVSFDQGITPWPDMDFDHRRAQARGGLNLPRLRSNKE